jgi:hypothetical protein
LGIDIEDANGGRVKAMKTEEDRQIARHTRRLLAQP